MYAIVSVAPEIPMYETLQEVETAFTKMKETYKEQNLDKYNLKIVEIIETTL